MVDDRIELMGEPAVQLTPGESSRLAGDLLAPLRQKPERRHPVDQGFRLEVLEAVEVQIDRPARSRIGVSLPMPFGPPVTGVVTP